MTTGDPNDPWGYDAVLEANNRADRALGRAQRAAAQQPHADDHAAAELTAAALDGHDWAAEDRDDMRDYEIDEDEMDDN